MGRGAFLMQSHCSQIKIKTFKNNKLKRFAYREILLQKLIKQRNEDIRKYDRRRVGHVVHRWE